MNFPSLHGNWVDLIIIVYLIVYVVASFKKGFLWIIVNLLGLILSFLLAIRFYPVAGEFLTSNFSLHRPIANAIGFFIAGSIAEISVNLLLNFSYARIRHLLLKKVTDPQKIYYLHRFDPLLGIIPSIIEGTVFIAFFLIVLTALPVSRKIKKDVFVSRIGGTILSQSQLIEKQLNAVLSPAIKDTISFVTVDPDLRQRERRNLKFTQTQTSVDEQNEQDMLSLLNEERAKVGVKLLKPDPRLTDLARTYAKDMFARGYFSHYNPEGESPFDRMDKAGITYLTAGENLALAPDVQLAHEGLMNSPGHRANILHKDFGHVGIGVIDGGVYGEMFVQEFTD